MRSRTTARSAWAIWALSIALGVIGAWLNVVNARTSSGVLAIHLFLVPGYATIGAVVASRSGNRIGWLFLAVGLASAGTAFAFEYSVRAVGTASGSLPFGPHMGAISNIAFPVTFMWIGGLLLLFPDGHLPSGRWRSITWAFLLTWSMIGATSLVDPQGITEGDFHFANPFAIPFARSLHFLPFENGTATGLWSLSAWGLLIVVATAPFFRRRRAASEEREQLKWIAFAIVFTLLSALIAGAATALAPDVGSWLAVVPLAMVALGIPIAVGIAILKYRLYEIDVVIKKTVMFAVVGGAVTAFYLIVAVALPAAVLGLGSGIQAWAVLVGVAIGLLIIPIRNRARRFADRLVYGKRATPYEVLEEFSGRMSEAYATEDVLPRMARILGEAVGAEHAQVWLHIGDELRPSGRWPSDDAPNPAPVRLVGGEIPPSTSDLKMPVLHQGELLGALEVAMPANDPMNPERERLVNGLASQAGLVLRNARLIEELRASRQRLVAAQDEERRKIERNIHDGAQQQLVALAVKLRLVEQFVERDTAKTRELLAQLQTQATDALEDLRDLARGIYPPLLADKGLPAALEAQARKGVIPVTIEPDGVGRYPQQIESAVYFSVLEALQNVAKYADASRVTVRLAQHGDRLTFEVTDDGRGFDPSATAYGTGLQGIADRLAALDGELDVTSTLGAGTLVVGRVPAGEVPA